ncbi:MAG: sulfite exporter TauE/SafE family protein [Terriglobia bacterium]
MTLPQGILLFFAAVVAGIMNAVAGGGSFFTFPALLFTGVPPIPANATSTVAVWPGSVASASAYRKRLPKSSRMLAPLIIASLAGGLLGATILLHTPQETFLRIIPFLFLGATLLFAFGKKIAKGSEATEQKQTQPSWRAVGLVTAVQFVISIYAGFFGGGMGILMLALFTFLPFADIHAMNSVKTLLAAVSNGVAIIAFVIAKIIFWPQAILMLTGAILGGYGGAHFAQKMNPKHVRTFVIVVGFTMSFIFLWKYQ